MIRPPATPTACHRSLSNIWTTKHSMFAWRSRRRIRKKNVSDGLEGILFFFFTLCGHQIQTSRSTAADPSLAKRSDSLWIFVFMIFEIFDWIWIIYNWSTFMPKTKWNWITVFFKFYKNKLNYFTFFKFK